MTDQHPLTDDIIRYDKKLGCQDIGTWIYTENDLRAAADWQLEQVIEWLKETKCNQYLYLWEHGAEMEKDELIADLKKAMRPQQQQEDN